MKLDGATLSNRQQWRNALKTYVYPVIGALQEADTSLALKTLEQPWRTKPEKGI